MRRARPALTARSRLTPLAWGAFTPVVPRRLSPFVLIIAAAALAGCFTVSGASKHAIPAVRVQASSDLDCPQREIRITQLIGARFEAIGCAHKIIYNALCEGLRCTVAPEGQVVPWRARPDPVP